MHRQGQQRDGLAAVRGEYGRLAADYDRRWSRYVARSVAATLAHMTPPAQGAVLDVGCGTGALLAALDTTAPGLALFGVDATAEMVRVAQARLGDRARFDQAVAEALPHDPARFELVVSSSAFHYFRNPEGALAEMYRVLRPGGHVVVTDWCADFLTVRLLDGVLRQVNRAHFRTYRQAALAALVTAAGFVVTGQERYKIDWFWGMMTLSARKPKD